MGTLRVDEDRCIVDTVETKGYVEDIVIGVAVCW
jgi:hypothetical protein